MDDVGTVGNAPGTGPDAGGMIVDASGDGPFPRTTNEKYGRSAESPSRPTVGREIRGSLVLRKKGISN